MDSSAPKRRKTSRTSSVPVVEFESTTPTAPPPAQQSQQHQRLSLPQRTQRPSFASPTRASLARHNPEILTRRRSAAALPPSRTLGDPEEAGASRPTTPDADENVAGALRAQLERLSEGDGTRPRTGPSVAPGDARKENGSSGALEGGEATSAFPRPLPRPAERPHPRPLPPPGPENDEDILGRALHPLPATGVLPVTIPEEPELPPTPEHPDPVVSTPPSGIHNTPSKRPRRSKIVAQQIELGSSPSKLPQKPPQKEPQKQKPGQLSQAERRRSPRLHAPTRPAVLSPSKTSVQPKPQTKAEAKPPSKFVPDTHPSRKVKRRDVDAGKKKQRDALLKEIVQLEADLAFATKENERLAKGLPSTSNKRDILDLLRRHVLPPPKEAEPNLDAEWLEAALNPIELLPFSSSSSLLVKPLFMAEDRPRRDRASPISHHPTSMTAEEELPYLQTFTPLTFTSTITMLPPQSGEDPAFQKHTINVRSANPRGLFSARIEMTVNTKTLAIANLAVPRLAPAAEAELLPFIGRIVASPSTNASVHGAHPATNPALAKNISIAAWSMAEWHRVALRRAKFWHALDRQLGSRGGLVECVAAMRTRSRKRRRRQPREDDDDDADSSQAGGTSYEALLSSADLLPHMGRTSMDLEIPYLADPEEGRTSDLRVNWNIDIDWTGEARSRIRVEVRVPAKWHSADGRKSLGNIPQMFDKLVDGGELPLMAVKTVVALLAGEARS